MPSPDNPLDSFNTTQTSGNFVHDMSAQKGEIHVERQGKIWVPQITSQTDNFVSHNDISPKNHFVALGGEGVQLRGQRTWLTTDLLTEDYTDLSVSDNQSGQPLVSDESGSNSPISYPCLQILGEKSFKCIYNDCGSVFTRLSDLKRHHRGIHKRCVSFYCRFAGCQRARRGFSRKDKRDDHERRLHDDTETAQGR